MKDKPNKVPLTGIPTHEATQELIRMCVDDYSLACFLHPKLRVAVERLCRADDAYQGAESVLYGAFEELKPEPMEFPGE